MIVLVSAPLAALIRKTGGPARVLRSISASPVHILAGVRGIATAHTQASRPGLVGDLVRRSSAILERGGHALVRVESDSPVSVEVADLSDLEDWICSLPPGSVTLGESSVFSPALELGLDPSYLTRLIEDGVLSEEGVQE